VSPVGPATPHAEPCPEGLLCALALDPESVPRNRYFWVYEEPRARRAHGRAHALRRLRGQLAQMLRSQAAAFHVREQESGLCITYRDEGLELTRRVHLRTLEISLLRLLLARDGVPVPALLQPGAQDRARVAASLLRIRMHPRLPEPSGWQDVLAPLAPATQASNTTE